MLGARQTLRNKKTNQLARLCGQDECSAWAWNLGSNTLFIDEYGNKFEDDIKNWTHVEDEFGRAALGRVKEGEFVATNLKKYLVSDEEKAKMLKESLERWEQELLKEMDEAEYEVRNPFADGGKGGAGMCFKFKEYFLNRMGAKPFYRKRMYSGRLYDGPVYFHYRGEMWVCEPVHDDLFKPVPAE